ncbi:DNA-binding protein [Halobaculum halobium]|uniref:DNA-binding protein n=1 Tax=Halobaculum halobium TaxID=3032281 RepID=A0ABD5TJ16_9EURY|nr:DNA-binding protein [Halobaculum sp. SYNS20]
MIDEAAEREAALRPTVEMETQAVIDTDNPAARKAGLTLEEAECIAAWEFEIARTVERADRGQGRLREACTQDVVETASRTARAAFDKRAASVDPRFDPVDPRERLAREELAAVNQEAARLEAGLANGTSRAALARQLAERVEQGRSLMSASLAVVEAEQTRPERVVDIARVGDVQSGEVSLEGEVTQLFEHTSQAIAQVGLIEDDTGTIKFTAWKRSGVDPVRVGERVRLCHVAKNWYNGRVSVSLTGWSEVEWVG